MKRAQAPIATLIILLAFFIVAYVLMMDPCERCKLLKTDCPDFCEDEVDEEYILLSESPGEVNQSTRK